MSKFKNWSATDINYDTIGTGHVGPAWVHDVTGELAHVHRKGWDYSSQPKVGEYVLMVDGEPPQEERMEIQDMGRKITEYPIRGKSDAVDEMRDWLDNHPFGSDPDFDEFPDDHILDTANGWELVRKDPAFVEYSKHFTYDGTRYVADMTFTESSIDVRIEKKVDGNWEMADNHVFSKERGSQQDMVDVAERFMETHGKDGLVKELIQ